MRYVTVTVATTFVDHSGHVRKVMVIKTETKRHMAVYNVIYMYNHIMVRTSCPSYKITSIGSRTSSWNWHKKVFFDMNKLCPCL